MNRTESQATGTESQATGTELRLNRIKKGVVEIVVGFMRSMGMAGVYIKEKGWERGRQRQTDIMYIHNT